MNDLHLWQQMRSTIPDPDEVVPLLAELAGYPVNQRLAFLGMADWCLAHEEARVRAAGVALLGGGQGIPVWKYLVAGLKDSDPSVQMAAVEALKRSAYYDPARWVHALYHPNPAVRESAEGMGAPSGFTALFPKPGFFESGWEDPYPEPITTYPFTPVPAEEMQKVNRVMTEGSANAFDVLKKFLERGPEVDLGPRLTAAEYLARLSQRDLVFPVLASGVSPELSFVDADSLEVAAKGITAIGGPDLENWFLDAVYNRAWEHGDQKTLTVLLTQSMHMNTRYWARDRITSSTTTQIIQLARLTRAFAWGIEMGRLLTGMPFQIEMLVTEHELGYTRLRENKLYITPLPILRGVRNGAEVVRALILHEYGHHMFHKGPEAEGVWKQGDESGLGRLLNLVADEHLERNLRQRNRRYGELLKSLNAYAFQHSMREVPVACLFQYLGEKVGNVLPRVPLGAARKHGHVVIGAGRFLREMEAVDLSFARFLRALRMGLGNRFGDPKVAQGLALFKAVFRKSSMPQLLDIAKKLREIFGRETDMLNHFGMDTAMLGDEADWLAGGPGFRPEAVQSAVDNMLQDADRNKDRKSPVGAPASLGMNLRPEETFNIIDNVTKLTHNPAKHAEYARRVARPARLLRRYFQDLGLGLLPVRGRIQGRHFDRTRTKDLILKSDPRLLIARKIQRATDLFLGVVIDCSGSMYGEKMEKARLFGSLLAEALNGQRGIDLRLFGFTDRAIYDAGDARRCAVHDLQATDGNNDAAGLWHAFRIAKASRRKARLLVMISDGLPTECTVAALKGLVSRLTRWHYCVAQVAVQPLEEICFPHYILLEVREFDVSVRKFGEVVMKLVGQALGK
jgi:hypothetical protein